MEYPPTTHYLTSKLNWMAGKLKAMNDPPTIKDWLEAMNCVFETLQAFSSNKELSAPMLVSRRKLDIEKALCITVKPIQSAVKRIKKGERPIFKGKRSGAARRLMETMKIKDSFKRKPWKTIAAKENAAQDSSMEIEGDVIKLNMECQKRQLVWVKAWWKRALWRELKKQKSGSRTRLVYWDDYKGFIERFFAGGGWAELWEQMIDEIEEVFPSGVPSDWITAEEFETYLIEEKYRDFFGQSND